MEGELNRWVRLQLFCVVLLFFGLLTVSAKAMDVSPLVHNLYVDDQAAKSQLDIRNSADHPLQVEMSVYHLELDPLTRQIYRGAPADDELLVFPPAAIIKPNAVQVVRVQWASAEVLTQADSFLVVVEQVPARHSASANETVQMILEFNAVVHVASRTFSPVLTVSRQGSGKGPVISEANSGETGEILVEIANTGTGTMIGDALELMVSAPDSNSVLVENSRIRAETGELFIPPGTAQSAWISLPRELLGSALEFKALYQSPSR